MPYPLCSAVLSFLMGVQFKSGALHYDSIPPPPSSLEACTIAQASVQSSVISVGYKVRLLAASPQNIHPHFDLLMLMSE